MASTRVCLAGHPMPAGPGRICPACRREEVVDRVAALETSLSRQDVAAAVEAVAAHHAVLRSLAAALTSGPEALTTGAPPAVGRLVTELIARGSSLPLPRCARCARTGRPLVATEGGGLCSRCAARRHPLACLRCGVVKPVAARTSDGQPICERCRRAERGHRACGSCGKIASIAVRARDGGPDVCVNCYRMPEAVCGVCGRHRECNFASSPTPICLSCSPRSTAVCARCGHDRPPAVRWEEGPLCDPCYTTALRHRGDCRTCGRQRRLVAPPGPQATLCADCAGLPVTHACIDCALEDKLYEKGRCARCSLRRRATELLSGEAGRVPAQLSGVLKAICAARTPRAALNWLRQGAARAVLAEVASGQLPITHEALDAHPHPRAADYLRHMLVAGGALAHRDETLARAQRWLDNLLSTIELPEHRRLVRAFATWQIMRRLRRRAETSPAPRTYTAHAKVKIKAAAGFLAWLTTNDTALTDCRQADIDTWLTTGPSACQVREFLTWAAEGHRCAAFDVPAPHRTTGTAIDPDQRWALVTRLLHDNTLATTDRVAGCLLLLFGQHQSRIAIMTTDQITHHGDDVFIRLGQHDLPTPEPLGTLLLQLITNGKSHVGIGSPTNTRWLFPGGMPGQPITASRLAERLRALDIPTQAARRATLTDLASQLPAAVLADLLNLSPATAVRWVHEAGGDWTRYAADLARTRNHQPREYPPTKP
ncbi:MAG TPA: hypothetical protein VFO15_16190 [Xanthobacteraceae bacterium]|nr:hypothetical protein [Xanthobacteraceae bacterium]